MVILIPTVFDLLATIVQSAGLLTISASVFQMVRGSEVVFAALFRSATCQLLLLPLLLLMSPL